MIGCQPLSTDRQSGVQLYGTSRELRIQSHRVARRPVEAGGTRCRPRCRVVGERRPAPRASRTDGQEPAHLILVETGRQLAAYFAGNLKAFNIPLDIKGTEFQKRLWAALLTMPFGESRRYGQIARRIGHPAAVRAVGVANGRNPISIVGLDAKSYLLTWTPPERRA
jgi:6-O-methylguanine DNA methyltransferase, DNA binding domain